VTELNHPIPVLTQLGPEGWIIGIDHAGSWANAVALVVLEDGRLLHFAVDQLRVVTNKTLGIHTEVPAEWPRGTS
jgi:hypothetical protein